MADSLRVTRVRLRRRGPPNRQSSPPRAARWSLRPQRRTQPRAQHMLSVHDGGGSDEIRRARVGAADEVGLLDLDAPRFKVGERRRDFHAVRPRDVRDQSREIEDEVRSVLRARIRKEGGIKSVAPRSCVSCQVVVTLSDSQVEKIATAMQEPSSPAGFDPSECRRWCNKKY